jgi:two-component system heavy metal sensor histidine kinase CusS
VSFRSRFVGAVSLVTIVTLGGSFTAVALVVGGAQERQLDEALYAEARREARDIARRGEFVLSDRPGPAANDVGPLPKYAAIYGPDGTVHTATETFHGRPPPRAELAHPLGACFDLRHEGESLRGVVTDVPGISGTRLLLATSRADLDSDEALLARAMRLVFLVTVVWSVAVATWVVRRFTRDHQRIAAVARRVAAGDLDARIDTHASDPEVAQLARDLDDMIARLGALVSSQRQFIAHAAHELRSPLTTLYGELSHALRRPRDAQEYRRFIEDALDSTRQLKQLAEDLLALARVGSEDADARAPVALIDCARDASGWTARAADERRVTVSITGDAANVLGRRRDLARMLRNLFDNALAHSPEGSTLDVRITQDAAHVSIAVTDQGAGVSAEDRARIFDPFYRGARERAEDDGGSGLGLAIAREIARAHGGDVTLDAAVTGGARFVVTLPRAE